jgi:hypothetical protein
MKPIRDVRIFIITCRAAIFTIGLVLVGGFPLWSQGPEEHPSFIDELLGLLAEEGWTAQELSELAEQDVDWEKAEGADPYVTALVLQYAKEEGEVIPPMTQALLAVDLARASIEMKDLGIGETVVAVHALEGVREEGVREILIYIRDFRSGEIEGNLGELIRGKVSTIVAAAVKKETRSHMNKRAKENKRKRPIDKPPSVPAAN